MTKSAIGCDNGGARQCTHLYVLLLWSASVHDYMRNMTFARYIDLY